MDPHRGIDDARFGDGEVGPEPVPLLAQVGQPRRVSGRQTLVRAVECETLAEGALGRSVVGPCSGPQGAAGAYLEQDLPKVWEAADDVFEHTPTGCDPDGGCGAADPVVREGPKRCVSLSASERNFPSRG